MPLEAVTSDSLSDADPIGSDPRPAESEAHDEMDGPAPAAQDDGAEVPAGGRTA